MAYYKFDKPAINVYYSPEIKDISVFDELLFGIEEEGIPYEVREQKEGNSLELSYKAAQESRLAVGIGIHLCGKITLTFKEKIQTKLFTLGAELASDEMGINFTTYVNKYKIEKAKEMLRNTDIPIVNIASELGYYECGYFTKIFKKVEGVTPTSYRSQKYKNY